MHEEKSNAGAKRAAVIKIIAVVAFTGLIGQLGHLTLQQQQTFQATAANQSTRTLKIPAQRGLIYDRNGELLAMNRPAYRLLLQYPYYKDEGLVGRLASILERSPDELEQLVEKHGDRPFEPVELATDLPPHKYTEIIEHLHELPGVEVQPNPVREYPHGELAAHVIGYVTGDNSSGQVGLEAFYEQELRGRPGARSIAVNVAGEPLAVVDEVAPQAGANLVLTIDAKLQKTAERALDWQMHRLQTVMNVGDRRVYQNAQAGAVVVIDVKTGAIRAMASRPAFDPNLFVGGIAEADWNHLNTHPYQPMLNRSVQAAYHPGSTWKMLTGAAALTAGITVPSERVFSGAVYEPTGQKDWIPGGHGWVDLVNALRLSSDIYFYEMGLRLGIDKQVEFAKAFGFGGATGVDLREEVGGFLPDSAYRAEHGWWTGQTSSSAIGQIFTTTPIQLARYTAALANGGKLMRPYLVERVEDAQGQVVRSVTPQQVGELPISADSLRTVVEGMKLVNSPTGTSDFAQWPLPGIATAGKTGTAENPPQDDYGLYVAFAPADNPELAVAVVIEQAGHGGSVSPVARTIFAEHFGVKLPDNDPARVPDQF